VLECKQQLLRSTLPFCCEQQQQAQGTAAARSVPAARPPPLTAAAAAAGAGGVCRGTDGAGKQQPGQVRGSGDCNRVVGWASRCGGYCSKGLLQFSMHALQGSGLHTWSPSRHLRFPFISSFFPCL